MNRLVLRLFAIAALAAGFGLVVVDGARSIAGNAFDVTAMGKALFQLFPRHFPLLEPALVRHVHPFLWDPVLLNLLLLPAFLFCFAAGLLALWLAGRPEDASAPEQAESPSAGR
jgi:hypothetical protein